MAKAALCHIDMHRLNGRLADDARSYCAADPFPHVVIDGIFGPATVARLDVEYPPVDDATWNRHIHANSHKHALADLRLMPEIFREVILELNSRTFIDHLQELTGIPVLHGDDLLVGAGLHQIGPGGFLDIHADFNYHPVTRAHRRLNLIVYLNRDWQAGWNGNLELWNADVSRCVQSIAPELNRAVIFEASDIAFHGHPTPLSCPHGRSRRSLAMYYYSPARPAAQIREPHSTLYRSAVRRTE